MIDLHCHILPGIDDGAADISVALGMARAFADDGVSIVACTPHILPGMYHNSGPQIRAAAQELQRAIDAAGIPLTLVTGADVHIAPDLARELREGRALSLADSRYVLIEPPHHVAPVRLEEIFFNLLVAGYVPILTHPERLTWINGQYATIKKLVGAGVWMQITAGSLLGAFGRQPLYWAERMLDEGCVHILATDAHDLRRRPPVLGKGRDAAARRVGDEEAMHLVMTRPHGIIANAAPGNLPAPAVSSVSRPGDTGEHDDRSSQISSRGRAGAASDAAHHAPGLRGFSERLRRLLQ